MSRLIFLAFLIFGLSACSARTCEFKGAYLEAQEYPELQNTGQGELPSRDPAYQLPPIPEQDYESSRSYKNADGKVESDCLDKPPRLIPRQA